MACEHGQEMQGQGRYFAFLSKTWEYLNNDVSKKPTDIMTEKCSVDYSQASNW